MSGEITKARNAEPERARPSLAHLVDQMRPEIERALPRHMDGDRMARLALTVLRQTPRLAESTPESFCGALLTAAALGLEPGVNGEAYLQAFRNSKTGTVECQLVVGYQGLAKLFWQHPLAKHLDAQAIYSNDHFDYGYGLEPYIDHKPAPLGHDRGQIVGYYAVAALTTGASRFVVMSAAEVAEIRNNRPGGGSRPGDIPDPQHWMERKTALRQLLKLMPKSTQLATALAVDEHSGTELAAAKIPHAIEAGTVPAEIVDPETGEIR